MRNSFFTFFAILSIGKTSIATSETCETKSDKKIECITLDQCTYYKNMLENVHIKRKVMEILQKANCGYEGRKSKVCCPMENSLVTETASNKNQKMIVKKSSKYEDEENRIIFQDDASKICTTEWNTDGECIPLPNCNHYNIIWNNSKATKNMSITINHLKRVQCGFVNRIPSVCCPIQNKVQGSIVLPKSVKPTTLQPLKKTSTEPTKLAKLNIENKFSILPSNCGELESDRIIAGNKTGIFEYPWMALIAIPPEPNLEAKFLCGGSIIHERYILTAAHCFKNSKPSKVRIGEHNLTTVIDCEGPEDDLNCAPLPQDIEVEETIIHPMYNKPKKQNDIALLRLKAPVDFSKDNVMAICLPLSEKLRTMKVVGKNMTVAGWGMTENFTLSDALLQAQIPIVENSKCVTGRRIIGDNQLCAGGKTNADSCKGDSGGPLMIASEVNAVTKMVQQGIVSYGSASCGTVGQPAVYTYVAKYIDWIIDSIKG